MSEQFVWEPDQFRKYYEHSVETDEVVASVEERKNVYLYEDVNFDRNDVVLDLGCGYGRVSKLIAGKVVEIVGVDINERNVRYAESYVSSKSFSAHCINIKENALPYPDRYFSKIILDNLVVFFDENELHRLFDELDRLLKPGGYILFNFENSHYVLMPFVLLFEKVVSIRANRRNIPVPHKKRVSLFFICRLFQTRNYTVESKGATLYFHFSVLGGNPLSVFKRFFLFLDEMTSNSLIKYVMSSVIIRAKKND